MSTAPRKQHYLPQFYLRGFSHGRTHLCQIEKATGRHYGAAIKDTGAIRDFYALDYEDVEDPHAAEKALAEFESYLAKTLSAFLLDGFRNKDAYKGVILLLSLLRYRIPAFKEHIRTSLAGPILQIAKAMERAGKLPPLPDDLKGRFSIDDLQVEVCNWKSVDLMAQMATYPVVIKAMAQMRGTLFEAPFGDTFITCDQPVSCYHPIAYKSVYGIGPLTPGVEITLPLNSRYLLQLDHESGPHRQIFATSEAVQEFNRRAIVMADKYIFCAAFPERHLGAIEQWREHRAGFHFDDLKTEDGFVQVQRYISAPPQSLAETA